MEWFLTYPGQTWDLAQLQQECVLMKTVICQCCESARSSPLTFPCLQGAFHLVNYEAVTWRTLEPPRWGREGGITWMICSQLNIQNMLKKLVLMPSAWGEYYLTLGQIFSACLSQGNSKLSTLWYLVKPGAGSQKAKAVNATRKFCSPTALGHLHKPLCASVSPCGKQKK